MSRRKNQKLGKINKKDQKIKLRGEDHVIKLELLPVFETGQKTRSKTRSSALFSALTSAIGFGKSATCLFDTWGFWSDCRPCHWQSKIYWQKVYYCFLRMFFVEGSNKAQKILNGRCWLSSIFFF